jgi:ATP-binding protein involved in chromosome partitioning
MDPRLGIIEKRLEGVKRVIGVASGKGGVGKSLTASTLALILSKKYRTGLLDLDFFGPSTDVVLGIGNDRLSINEDRGIVPQKVYGIEFMSIVYFAGDNPLAFRGGDVSNSIIELLAITRWGPLDFLIIDMPPGIGDATLDMIRLIKKMEFLILTTPSKVALGVVKKELRLLEEGDARIIGVIENMTLPMAFSSLKISKKIGSIDYDKNVESAIGDMDRLLETNFAKQLEDIVLAIL